MIATLLLLAAAAAEAEPPPFTRSPERRFADAEACRAHLGELVSAARSERADAAEGPYEIEPGDVRAHVVRAEGHGHRIAEYRCAGAELASRSWSRSMEPAEAEFTVESVARRAGWGKERGRQ